MGEVVKAPMRRVYPPRIRGKQIWAQDEPPPEMVWEVCPYARRLEPCQHCPEQETDESGRVFQRGCYGLAAEVCRIVFACQAEQQEE